MDTQDPNENGVTAEPPVADQDLPAAPQPKSPAQARADELRDAYADFLVHRGESQSCDIAFAGPTPDDRMVWHCFSHKETWETLGGAAKPRECPAVTPKPDETMLG